MMSRSNIGAVAPMPRSCSRLVGHDADLVLAGGCLRCTGIRPEACSRFGVVASNSGRVFQNQSRVLGARIGVPQWLGALHLHTLTSR